jgi:hypothetical protein
MRLTAILTEHNRCSLLKLRAQKWDSQRTTLPFQNATANTRGKLNTSQVHKLVRKLSKFCFKCGTSLLPDAASGEDGHAHNS